MAQFAGYVAEKRLDAPAGRFKGRLRSSYHHGEASLQATIIGMAQDFVGSNNVNLLAPQGQFGTRIAGGKDHAAARYIFTRCPHTARYSYIDVLDRERE